MASNSKLVGHYLLRESRWCFTGGSSENPLAPKGTLLGYVGPFPYDWDSVVPHAELKPKKGDHWFHVESEGPFWALEIALRPDEVERFVEPVKVVVVRWLSDENETNIKVKFDSGGKEQRFKTQADLIRKLNEILKKQGVLIDGALIWCLDLPWKTSQCKFYPKGSKID